MGNLESLAGLSVKLGDLAHELQKERGMSAGFLGSKGSRFAAELPAQRSDSDNKIAALRQRLNGLDTGVFGREIEQSLAEALKNLEEIKAKRDAISALAIAPKESFVFYTHLIEKLLSVPNMAPTLSTDIEILRPSAAYAAMLYNKEHSGQERAVLTGIFTADQFTPESLVQFLSDRAEQKAHEEAFETYALPAQRVFYKDKMSGQAVAEVARIENLAVERVNEKSLGVDSGIWFKVMTEKINLLKEVEDKLANDLLEVAKKHKNEAQSLMVLFIVISVVGLLVTIMLVSLIIRSLLGQIGGEPDYAASIVKRIADGDLTVAVDTKAGDQSSLLFAMKHMSESLTAIVSGVRSSTDTINVAAQEIAQDNAGLSQRTEEQASGLQETASSMEELTAAVRHNADNARQANQLANSASGIAVKGGQVVGDVVHTMASISDSSKKIVDIISVIDSIAFQTNILALNAAVEAARAGEQGRGFAVVAGEVRNLAQRSASAAKEIKELINDSVHKVDVGSKQVDQAGATMSEIVQAVKRVTDIMSEIAAASNEQSAGIEQVNQAITQMDEITQQNAALVEEAAASAESLEEQAFKLKEAMSIFKLESSVHSRTSAAQ
ncbi:MAG: methyl-accepting chemotaxis protein, partial [Gallionella sp.]|nr:methyl-accepting chemotaxis protein [Gallionella sp.]